MNQWLSDCVKRRVAHRTCDAYQQCIHDHINPSIGHIKLAKLSPVNIQALYNAKLGEGLKPGTVRNIYIVLHGALEQALKWNLVVRNPASDVAPQR